METIFFATNRQPFLSPNAKTDDDIIGFGADPGRTGGMDVRYGSADIDVNLAKRTSRFIPNSLRVAPEKLLVEQGQTTVLGSNTIFDAIRQSMKDDGKPTLVLIHGFSNSFTDSIERAGWIRAFYGFPANMFVFSWPSQTSAVGVPLPYADYEHDRKTAGVSGVAIARTIRRLHDFVESLSPAARCDQSIHLICHSMGVYVMRNALQALLHLPSGQAGADPNVGLEAMVGQPANPSTLKRTFDKIILAAGDEDADAFDDPAKLKFLPRLGQGVTVYYTHNDWVLGTLSDVTKFNGPRLGFDGPDNMSSVSDKVAAVDVSAVIDGFREPENHQYYRVFEPVRDDIVSVLKGKPQEAIRNRKATGEGRWRIVARRASS